MIEELAKSPAAIFMVLAAVFYIVLMRWVGRLEYKYKLAKEPFTDQFCLERLAVMRGVGEYEIFNQAANKWHVRDPKKEDDFKTYLMRGHIPHYVRDFVREHKNEIEKSCSPHFPPGDSLPPSWPA